MEYYLTKKKKKRWQEFELKVFYSNTIFKSRFSQKIKQILNRGWELKGIYVNLYEREREREGLYGFKGRFYE